MPVLKPRPLSTKLSSRPTKPQAQLEAIRARISWEKQIAQTEIANEREAAIREMRNEVVTLSMAVAEKLLQKNMDPDMNAKLVADCIDQLQTHRVKGN